MENKLERGQIREGTKYQPKALINRCTSEVVASTEQLTNVLKPVITTSSRAALVPASTQLHGEQDSNHHST
ncbi:hypothetical protein ACOSQ2_010407 [Xanthoceras sorbifolium]